MALISKLAVCQTLYTVTVGKMGNTNLSTVNVHPVRVIEIDSARRFVVARWNGNIV